jgi:hypothetical protein
MVFGTRSEDVFRRIEAVFGATEEPKKRHRPLAYLKLYSALFQGAIGKYLLKRA